MKKRTNETKFSMTKENILATKKRWMLDCLLACGPVLSGIAESIHSEISPKRTKYFVFCFKTKIFQLTEEWNENNAAVLWSNELKIIVLLLLFRHFKDKCSRGS